MTEAKKNISFHEILGRLSEFWDNFGCVLVPPAQTEISSPLFHQLSFFNMVDDNRINLMYFQPHVASKEFKNIKYNMQNYSFLKFQVILKNGVDMPQKVFLDSLEYMGFSIKNNDIRFKNSEFENFIFRINANGYEVSFNAQAIAKIYYVQGVGCHESGTVPITISYNLDRILTILQDCNSIWDVSWNGHTDGNRVLYRDIMFEVEKENYDFINDDSINDTIMEEFENHRKIAISLLDRNIIIPAYISTLRAKYCLDILNFRNFITFNNRTSYNKMLRDLIDRCCEGYIKNKKTGV